ncbi:PAAR domain-containing protein [Caballeronia sp.]|uniref:PAAR domain-containing protein n=1 Tax=Caballeronia sp. TaxID=1931223 RepID=UPI003C66F990
MKEDATNEIKYLFATIGSLTARGGRVTTATGGPAIADLDMARVGDVVTYPDGSEAVIMDGAGLALVLGGQPAALAGSSLSNGDRIIETLQQGSGISVRAGSTIDGLFDADYVPPHSTDPIYRFAVKGATTRLGGVLREATSSFDVRGTHRKSACVGDFIEYADGTRAKIITGVGLPDTPTFQQLAVVGSLLDNGDVINDSPDRDPQTSTNFVPVDKHGVAIPRQ